MYPRAIYILLILGSILTAHSSFAQSKNIKGQVVLFNSKTEHGKVVFVKNAKISSPISGSVLSDEKGRFKLKLNKVYDGQPIFFQVHKDDYQVVDHKSLQYTLIDKKTRVRVSLAKKGYIKQLRENLNSKGNIALNSEVEELLDLLAFGGPTKELAIETIGKRSGRKLNNAFDAEKLIDELAEKVEENIRYAAYELAIINHDFASDFWLSALESYYRTDLEATVEKLKEANVDQLAETILTKIEKVKNRPSKVDWIILNKSREIERIKDNYTFQIIALQQSLRLSEADLVLKKLAKINEVAPSHKHTQILDKLNFYKINIPFQEDKKDENIVLQEVSEPVISKNKMSKKRRSPLTYEDLVEKNRIAKTQKTKNRSKKIEEQNEIIKTSEIILENNSTPILTDEYFPIEEEINTPTNQAPTIQKPNSLNKIKTSEPYKIVNNNQHIPAPSSNAIDQNNVRTKIVITISTTNEVNYKSTSNPVPTPPAETTPQSYEIVETIQKVDPMETQDKLVTKGETNKSPAKIDGTDFENILFQSKVVKKKFNSYLNRNAQNSAEDKLQ